MIKVPGKIFISGEYAALKGLPALTVAVNPCFEFRESKNRNPFHESSPAGKLNPHMTGDFYDPYSGIGGLGRSTAEFIVAENKKHGANLWDIWTEYRKLFTGALNVPSGVDLLTQLQGGYCLIETSKKSLLSLNWPFVDMDWVALMTGNKTKTHEHLDKTLKINWPQLEIMNKNVIDAFLSHKSEILVSHLNLWREFLFKSELETPATTELVEFFMEIPEVLAVKGCGALGSDVVFIIFKKNSSEIIEKSLKFWSPDKIIRSNQVCSEGTQGLNCRENISTL